MMRVPERHLPEQGAASGPPPPHRSAVLIEPRWIPELAMVGVPLAKLHEAPAEGSKVVDEYIRAGLRQEPPVVELWPSQQKAVPVIVHPSRPDFCLKMPTSSGKTRDRGWRGRV